MGLGKTLESLMLVLANPPPKGWAVGNLARHAQAHADSDEPVPIKSTLIVMPANLLEQWQAELALHVRGGALVWCASCMLPLQTWSARSTCLHRQICSPCSSQWALPGALPGRAPPCILSHAVREVQVYSSCYLQRHVAWGLSSCIQQLQRGDIGARNKVKAMQTEPAGSPVWPASTAWHQRLAHTPHACTLHVRQA